uniref:N-acetylglucosaminyl deacetylase, LmbE family n=1 Tax=Candidatus Kentrum sp. FM TaxID=2126340 RepID=A0A450STC9_9GAMM|nr:MAG: N-acetylglucosaminyl deacetylase, LmbE family [Candidatus Kentron sp. FM]VFJ57293.1 MAG: N-acetylglucosaminyl deacetylase, LmbE family [Candidatus Kentron sp. FM]VFK08927.1 MAG: N-acetylglucosaminyl deacetylase, LmbE family [Candidatus Kentron sp. FM]
MVLDGTQVKTTLIVAAHPDDEILGCGDTIAGLAARGVQVHVAFMADGVFSRDGGHGTRRARLTARREMARQPRGILGITSINFGALPDNRLDTVALLDIIEPIETLIGQHRPDIVFTHHAGDVNIDHRRVHEAGVTACRPQRRHCVRTLLFFEIPSSTEWQPSTSAPVFAPNWFLDISTTLERKLTAPDAYATELRPWPHPRSRRGIEHLVRWWRATIGVDAAEAFLLGRQLS